MENWDDIQYGEYLGPWSTALNKNVASPIMAKNILIIYGIGYFNCMTVCIFLIMNDKYFHT